MGRGGWLTAGVMASLLACTDATTSSPLAAEPAEESPPDAGLQEDAAADAPGAPRPDAGPGDGEEPPPPACSGSPHEKGLVERTLLGGRFYTYVPSTYDPKTPRPLVVALHGGRDTAKNYLTYEWQTNADARGLVVLAPEATGEAATGFLWIPEDRSRILAALDDVHACYAIAPKKTVLQGFSLGAEMALFLGLPYSQDFAGIAVASGGLLRAETTFNSSAALAPATSKIPVTLWRGTSDPIVTANDVTDTKTRLEAAGHSVIVRSFKGAHKTSPADALAQYDELTAP